MWICTKITYAYAKKYLSCAIMFCYWKFFCLKQPQKTETFLGNNNRMEWDDNRVRVSPQRETFDSHNLQNLLFFSLKRSYSSLCDKPYEGRNVKMVMAYMAYLWLCKANSSSLQICPRNWQDVHSRSWPTRMHTEKILEQICYLSCLIRLVDDADRRSELLVNFIVEKVDCL